MGLTKYIVKDGDCIESIAYQHGHYHVTLWEHPANHELKESRDSPNVLLPGDVVWIPDRVSKLERIGTGAVHRFRRKGVPSKYRVLILDDEDEPIADAGYILMVDERRFEGRTTSDGWIDHWIPPDALRGTLEVNGVGKYEIRFGSLDPVSSEEGARARLQSLGYLDPREEEVDEDLEGCVEVTDELLDALARGEAPAISSATEENAEDEMTRAVRRFQADRDLSVTGALDEDTLQALVDAYGC